MIKKFKNIYIYLYYIIEFKFNFDYSNEDKNLLKSHFIKNR